MRTNTLPMRLTSPLTGLLDSFFSDHMPEVYPGQVAPPTNIAETADGYELSFEMPGLAEEDINLDVQNRRLTVTAERRAEAKTEGKTWHRLEQRYGKWSRTIQLPEAADVDSIEAVYRQGVLVVSLTKHPKSKPVRIQVKGS